MRQLKIDPEFRDKIPPLSTDEYSRLEANILEDGEVREPIVVWVDTIIDGHNRWKIIQSHDLTNYTIKQMNFADKYAAIVWMCHNQMGRRNLSDVQQTVLIAEAFKAQKMTHGGDRGTERDAETGHFTARDHFGPLRGERTKSIIAKQFGVGQGTVQRAEQFANGLDAAETVSPGVKEAVLSGKVSLPKSTVAEIRNLPDEDKKEVAEAIKAGDAPKAKEIIRRNSPTQKEEENRGDFTAEDLRGLLSATMDTLKFSLETHLVQIHMDILSTKAGRDVAIEYIEKGHSILEYFNKHIRSVKVRVE